MSSSGILDATLDIVYGGVDFKLPGNGGADCVGFLTVKRRTLETLGYVLFNCILLLISGTKTTCEPPSQLPRYNQKQHCIKTTLLVVLCLVFGIELGYKLATKQLIYILNPCHILTIAQIILLCLPQDNKWTTIIFRIHIHLLFGAFLAIVLPVVNSRLLPFEVATYWIQHILIFFIVPPFLMSIGGSFTTETPSDFTWSAVTSALFCFYMFLFLQPLGLISQVNLNNMICPAISDPFYGENYRLCAMFHQQFLVLTFGKIYSLIMNTVLLTFPRMKKIVE